MWLRIKDMFKWLLNLPVRLIKSIFNTVLSSTRKVVGEFFSAVDYFFSKLSGNSEKNLLNKNSQNTMDSQEKSNKSTLGIFQVLDFTKSYFQFVDNKKNLVMQEEKKIFHEKQGVLVEALVAIKQCKADVKSAVTEMQKLNGGEAQGISEDNLLQIHAQDSQVPAYMLDLFQGLQMILQEIASEPLIPKYRDTFVMHGNIKIWSEQIENIKSLTEQLLLATYEFTSKAIHSTNHDVCKIFLS